MAELAVIAPGLVSTIQDFGRFGWRELGVPVAGALDPVGLRLANALVGNPGGMAGIEICYRGPTLRVEADSVRLAVCGPARLRLSAGDGATRTFAADRSHRLTRGDVLEIGGLSGASVATLAVSGGFDLPPVLGSLSTAVRAGIGPLGGRPLAAGTLLPLCRAAAPDGPDLALAEPMDYGEGPVRVVMGPQADHFTEEALAAFLSQSFTIGRESDRMGLRLEGPILRHKGGADIPSDGLVSGCIQVPGSGAPIILLADHQTVGGYAKIATVISADLPRLGRMMPGSRIGFAQVTVEAAEAARRALESAVMRKIAGLRRLGGGEFIDLSALYDSNLVSGVVDMRREGEGG